MPTVKRKSANQKILGSISLILLGTILFFGKPQEQQYPVPEISADFSSEPVVVEGFNAIDAPQELLPRRIVIPSAEIDLDVSTSRIINGYWEVHADKAGWGEGSGLPGEAGNQVIFAHARQNLFASLADVVSEDRIYVLTDEAWYRYRVTDIFEVNPDNLAVIEPTVDETLTLYTCSGYNDEKRLIVVAKRT